MGDDRELLFDLCLKKSRNSIQESNSENLLSITADTKFLSAISRGCSGAEITGAWRDGVVKTLTKMNKDLLLGVTVDVETEPLTGEHAGRSCIGTGDTSALNRSDSLGVLFGAGSERLLRLG